MVIDRDPGLAHGAPVKRSNQPSSKQINANCPGLARSNSQKLLWTRVLDERFRLSYTIERWEAFTYLRCAISRKRFRSTGVSESLNFNL